MTRTTVTTIIAAPLERVFATIADLESFQRAIPHIESIEFLTEQRQGAGTRFRETRVTKGRRSTTELEIVGCVANESLRIVTDSHGTIWDSRFAFLEVAGGTELKVTLEARSHQLIARLTTPMVMPLIRNAMEGDLELIKRYCEDDDRQE